MPKLAHPPDVRKPRVYVVSGPNGAGKSTFAWRFLPEYADCREFVNADLIAAGLSPFNQAAAALSAGRVMLDRIRRLAASQVDFGFETTLAGRNHIRLLSSLRQRGYEVHLFFLWLPDADLAVSRISERVLAGGHPIPEEVVRRRFVRSIRNFFSSRRTLADLWILFDNSGVAPRRVASGAGQLEQIWDPSLFEVIRCTNL